jgi:hypothetical protein
VNFVDFDAIMYAVVAILVSFGTIVIIVREILGLGNGFVEKNRLFFVYF